MSTTNNLTLFLSLNNNENLKCFFFLLKFSNLSFQVKERSSFTSNSSFSSLPLIEINKNQLIIGSNNLIRYFLNNKKEEMNVLFDDLLDLEEFYIQKYSQLIILQNQQIEGDGKLSFYLFLSFFLRLCLMSM